MYSHHVPQWSFSKFQIFLLILDENLDQFSAFECNGWAFMHFRAHLIKEESKHLERINEFMSKTTNEIQDLARLYKKYKEIFRVMLINVSKTKEQIEQDVLIQLTHIFKQNSQEIKKKLEKAKDIYFFIHSMITAIDAASFLQLKDRNQRPIKQEDFNEILQLVSVDQFPKIKVDRVFEVGFNFTTDELINIIRLDIYEGDLVHINNDGHSVFMTKQNGQFIYFDPYPIVIPSNNPNQLVEVIEKKFFRTKINPPRYMSLCLTIFENAEEKKNIFRRKRETIIIELLKKRYRPNLNATDWEGNTAMHALVTFGHIDIINLIIQKVNLNIPNREGNTALLHAILNDQFDCVKTLLKHDPSLCNQINKDGWTAIHTATYYNNYAVVKELLENGADINRIRPNVFLPLKLAIIWNHLEILSLLLPYSNLDTVYNNLCYAIFKNKEQAIKLLCRCLPDKNGNTLLHLAAIQSNSLMIEKLLKYGADPHKKNNEGISPLDWDDTNLIRKAWLHTRPSLSAFSVINGKRSANSQDVGILPPSKKIKI